MARQAVDELVQGAARCLQQGLIDEAALLADSALTHAPSNTGAQLLRALIAVRSNDAPTAARLIDRILKRNPRSGSALRLLAALSQQTGDSKAGLQALIKGLAFERGLDPADGVRKLFPMLVRELMSGPLPNAVQLRDDLSLLCVLGAKAGAEVIDAFPVETVLSDLQLEQADDRLIALQIPEFCDALGLGRGAGTAWDHRIATRALVPLLHRLLERGRLFAALILEAVLLRKYVQSIETEAHFRDSLLLWKQEMRNAGAILARAVRPAPDPDGPPTVVFFLHQMSELAHVRLLCDSLLGMLRAEASPPLVPVIAYAQLGQPNLLSVFRHAGIEALDLTSEENPADMLIRLRDWIAERGAAGLVWVSSPLWMSFAFGMRMAPCQIWWAMKYHAFDLPEIDGYLTAGHIVGGTKIIHGRVWRAGPVAAEDWFCPGKSEAAGRTRVELNPPGLVYGCFAREEKLVDDAFLGAVVEVLRAAPDAMFLWTGRLRHPKVQTHFEHAGVADRCRFIGWVDTRMYAQVIDVFLDSFPFPCGYTLYEAMAAGKPPVILQRVENQDAGIRQLIEPLLEGLAGSPEDQEMVRALFRFHNEDLYLLARSVDEYIALAARLAADTDFRQRSGKAARGFVTAFMTDRERQGRLYAAHILDIVEETRARECRSSP